MRAVKNNFNHVRSLVTYCMPTRFEFIRRSLRSQSLQRMLRLYVMSLFRDRLHCCTMFQRHFHGFTYQNL